MSCTSNILSVPEWLNTQFLEKVLINNKKDDSIKVTNLKTTPATLKGDHYASVMYRAKVEYISKAGSETISLILKTLPHEEGTKKDLLGGMFIFETEIGMYSDTIPKFQKLLQKAGDDIKLGGSTLFYSLKPQQVIIFEDLVEIGFDILRNRRFTKQETEAAAVKIAKWHAASYILHDNGDKTISEYSHSLFSMSDLVKSSFISTGVHEFTDMLSRTKGLEVYHEKFLALKDSLVEKCIATTQAYFKGEKGHFVLNHGDFHIKNVMVKLRENGDLEDLRLVDFQLCFFGPALYDIIFMLYGIADSDTRINHRDEVIYFYFQTFLDSLKKMGFKGGLPKLADLKIDLLRHRHYEVFFFVTFMPLIMTGETMAGELDTTAAVENAEYRKNFYNNKEFVEEARVLLPFFLHQGFLD